MYSIIVFIPYFGKWPVWIDLFFDSVRRNKTIDFLIYTDCDINEFENLPNVSFRNISFEDYLKEINNKLSISFNPPNAYKICDLRPMFGFIHKEEFRDYDFYGWCDLDLVFGNIREFYTHEILSTYNVLSTHDDRISGHFVLFRNIEKNRKMFEKIYRWKEALLNLEFVGIDEWGLTRAYTDTIIDKINDKFKLNIKNKFTDYLKYRKTKGLYFKEQYTTPFIPKPWLDGTMNSAQPNEWYYNQGEITNSRDKGRKFIYLHFMNFKSSQWRHDGTKAPWEQNENYYQLQKDDLDKLIVISEKGIYAKI